MNTLPEPLADRILIDLTRTDRITTSGLIIPHTDNPETPYLGTVLAIGPGRQADWDPTVRLPMEVSVGDVVLISRYGGVAFHLSDRAYIVVAASEVLVRIPTGGEDD